MHSEDLFPSDYFLPSIFLLRYDLFFKRTLLEQVGDIEKAYQNMAQHIKEKLPACQVEAFYFESDESALRLEMERNGSPEGLFFRVVEGWGGMGCDKLP